MRSPRLELTSLGLGLAATAAILVIAAVMPSHAAAPTPTEKDDSATVALVAGQYRVSLTMKTAPSRRVILVLHDDAGREVSAVPVTGLLSYYGPAQGHEHHDIIVSQETAPGRYELDLDGVISGPWILKVAVDREVPVAYPFTVP